MAYYTHIESSFIHGGAQEDSLTGAVNIPIYQTSTYRQEAIGRNRGWEYSRTGNPTRAALERLIAELEGGTRGFAFASGLAAISTVLMLLKAGDRVVISRNVYGGTYRLLDKVFARFGLAFTQVDTTDLGAVAAALARPGVKAVLVESPTNPLLEISDLREIAAAARAHGVLSIADNTFMTPYLQRPLELGFDIVVHSATKYLGGHSDVVAGLAVTRDAELGERLAFLQNAAGGVLGPFDSFLLVRGIKTLGVRMDRHVANAVVVADFLAAHPAVRKVYYPGLAGFPGHDLQLKQARNGGAMIAFELRRGWDVRVFFSAVRLVALAESLGGVESLACHPASMTHASIPPAIRRKIGVTDGLIRLSVGIENVDDIVHDLQQAIRKSEIKNKTARKQ